MIAAVFVCIYFKNDLLFSLLSKNLASLDLKGNRIRVSRTRPDEFTLELLSESDSPKITSQWKPDWSLRRQSLELSGLVKYQHLEMNVRLGIPLTVSLKPLQSFSIELSSVDNQWLQPHMQLKVSQENRSWIGKGEVKIRHPEWGEFSPEIWFDWGDKQELSLLLKPDHFHSKVIQLEKAVELKIEREQGLIKSGFEVERLILSSNVEFKNFKMSLEQIPNQNEIRTVGSLASFSSLSPPYQNLKEVFAKGTFQGKLKFGEGGDYSASIKGELNDNLQSVRIPFQFQKSPKEQTRTAQFDINLFEGCLLERVLKEHIKEAKLLNGSIKGELKNQKIKWWIEPTNLLFGDYLFSSVQGQGIADTKKETLSVRDFGFNFADGRIRVEPFDLLVGAQETALNFKAEGLQIKKILSSAAKGKLTGQGLFRGKGRFMFSPNGSYLSALNLENATPGTISYLDPSQPYFDKKIVYLDQFQDLLAQGQQALVLKALENFHYTRLQIQADRPSSDHMKVLLNLKGKNPDLAKGQLFDINLPIEGDIDSLVKGSLFQQPLTDELHKRHIETE